MKQISLTMLCISMLLSGCSDSESPIDDGQNGLLSVADVGFSLKSENDKSEADFKDGAEIGLYIQTTQGSAFNKLTYLNPRWALDNPVFLSDNDTDLYAVYPYNPENSISTSFEIEHTSQTDYLYSDKHSVKYGKPELFLEMKHALALIEFEFVNSIVTENSTLDFISIDGWGLYSKANLDLLSGDLQYITSEHQSAEIRGSDLDNPTIQDGTKFSLMTMPVDKVIQEGDIMINFYLLDGIKAHWPVPAGTKWESGKRYTYQVRLNERFLEILDVRILEWVDAGKEGIHLPYN